MIESKIDSLLDGIMNVAKTERLGLHLEPARLRVVVLASTAGGTGSGAFIDMGYLAKWLAKNYILGPKVDLCLILPGCFSGVGRTGPEANTYAALMELETCMGQGNPFVKGWRREGDYLGLPQTPYDDIFLIDNKNLTQKRTAKTTEIYDMVADNLFEDFVSSDFSHHKSTIRVCHTQYKVGSFTLPVDSWKYGSMTLKYSKAYSTFGQSVIETQLGQLQDEFAYEQVTGKPLIKILEEMDSSERRALFQNCLENAMPWLDANISLILGKNTNQYTCIVGVDGAKFFEQKFGEEFKSAIPSRTGLLPKHISFYESGILGKLTCYVELSGLPLTALIQLPKWRESYEEENKRFPVHIHKDRSLFVHPLAPTSAILDRLAEHFKLFIQGIVLGVLKQRLNDSGDLDYCLTVSGEELSIGNERLMRLNGMVNEVQNIMQSKVAYVIEQFKTPAQHGGLIALYDFYAQCVYPPAIVRDECGRDVSQESFAHVMCCKLGEKAQKTLKEKYPDEETDLVVRLKGKDFPETFEPLDIWTDEIKGSETDVYAYEVGKAHRPKRVMKTEFFQVGWLENRFKIRVEKQEESIQDYVPPQESGSRGNFCSSCGEQVNGSPKFCPHCGNQMKSGKKCSGCGCAIEGNPKFCPECGAKQGGGLQCSGCGCSIEGNPKFCLECGQSFHVGALFSVIPPQFPLGGEQNNPLKKRVEPIRTERVYYVKSQHDKTVLVAMNVEIVGKYIKWFDCTKQRVMQIDKILQDDDSLFTFQRDDANHGFEYSFIKMTLSVYNEHVKNELISPEEFTDEATMTESFQLTVRSAW